MFFGKKLIRAYVVLFYYVPNQNKVFLPINDSLNVSFLGFVCILFSIKKLFPVCKLHHVETNVLLIKKEHVWLLETFFTSESYEYHFRTGKQYHLIILSILVPNIYGCYPLF